MERVEALRAFAIQAENRIHPERVTTFHDLRDTVRGHIKSAEARVTTFVSAKNRAEKGWRYGIKVTVQRTDGREVTYTEHHRFNSIGQPLTPEEIQRQKEMSIATADARLAWLEIGGVSTTLIGDNGKIVPVEVRQQYRDQHHPVYPPPVAV